MLRAVLWIIFEKKPYLQALIYGYGGGNLLYFQMLYTFNKCFYGIIVSLDGLQKQKA